VICGLFADLVLLVFAGYRTVALESLRALVFGVTDLARHLPALRPASATLEQWTVQGIASWYVWVAVRVMLFWIVGALLIWAILGAVLERLAWIPLPGAPVGRSERAEAVQPVPVRIDDVGFTYAGADGPVLRGVHLSIEAGSSSP
jgi:hypothetical protein